MKTNQKGARERQKQEEKESKEKHKKYINTQNTSYNPSILSFKKKPPQ